MTTNGNDPRPVEWAIDLQKRTGATGVQIAKDFGINNATWSKVKAGRYEIWRCGVPEKYQPGYENIVLKYDLDDTGVSAPIDLAVDESVPVVEDVEGAPLPAADDQDELAAILADEPADDDDDERPTMTDTARSIAQVR